MVGEKKRRETGDRRDVLLGEGAEMGDSVQNEASTPSILFPTLVLWVQILGGEG